MLLICLFSLFYVHTVFHKWKGYVLSGEIAPKNNNYYYFYDYYYFTPVIWKKDNQTNINYTSDSQIGFREARFGIPQYFITPC